MAVSDLLLNILSRSDKRGLTEAADELDKLGRKADDAGDKLGEVAKESGHVDEQITKTKAKIRELGEEFDRTGSKELLPQLRRERGSLNALEKIKKEIADVGTELNKLGGGDGFGFGSAVADIGRIIAATLQAGGSMLDVAKGVASTIGTGVQDGLSSLSSLVQDGFSKGLDAISGAGGTGLAAWLVPGIAAAAPAIGAAINAGVLLGVGGGALAAGIIAAAQDQQVQAAYKDLGGFVVQTFRTASEPLVAPLLRGAAQFEHAWMGMLPGVRQGLAQLGPVIDRLVDGLVGMLRNVGPGFGRAFEASLPLLKQVGDELPKLGSALSSFFDSMAAGGPGAVTFFHDLMTAIDMTVVWVGKLVEWLSKAWELSNKIPGLGGLVQILGDATKDSGDKAKGAGGDHKELADALDKTSGAASRTSDLAGQVGFAAQTAGLGARIAKVDFGVLSQAISDVGSTSDMLAGKMTDRLMGTMLGMSHATLGVQSSLLNMKDTLDSNGLAIDRHTGLVSMSTKAGISNRESVLGAIEANLRMYDAQINSGVGADVATAKYEQNTKALHDQLRQAGLTEAQVGDLIGEYGKVPGKVNTAIAMNGLTEAINGLNDLLREILGLPSKKTITIEQITKRIDAGNVVPSTGGMRIQRWGGITEHAETGLLRDATVYSSVSSGARYAFAEPATGGELFAPKYGDLERTRGLVSYGVENWWGGHVVWGDGAASGTRGGGMARAAAPAAGYVDSRTVNYNIYDATDPDRVVAAISTYERNNGPGWRS